jgi:hypothetical protein
VEPDGAIQSSLDESSLWDQRVAPTGRLDGFLLGHCHWSASEHPPLPHGDATAIVWRRRPLGSHDQGVHNYLLRTGRLETMIVTNGTGRVLTMGGMSHIRRADDGTVLNDNGTIPAILHQSARKPQIGGRPRSWTRWEGSCTSPARPTD